MEEAIGYTKGDNMHEIAAKMRIASSKILSKVYIAV
jgi:hypothetical protein